VALKYRKDHGHSNQENMWTSYSDLFMGLSFVFLLLYVTASLRSGTTQFQNGSQLQKMAKENEELKNQVRVYESMRKDYLEQQANPDESKMYQELMSQLDLLQDKTKQERIELQTAANANANKEKALNKYQQLVKSIIDTNFIAKSKIKKRENVIEEQDQEINVQSTQISEQNSQISQLNQEMLEKQQELVQGKAKIQDIQASLDAKVTQLKRSYQAQKMSEAKFKEQQAALKNDADKKMEELRGYNSQIQSKISSLDEQLGQAQKAISDKEVELGSAKQELGAKEKALAMKEQETHGLKSALGESESKLKNVKGKLAGTEMELQKARAEADARKKIAQQVADGLRKAGVKADVDGVTGDVTIDFGDHFFESGSSKLKPEMRKILEKALPVYSRSLMDNKTVSDKLSSLEIVGYASPTYKGRYIDPKSVKAEDKKAVEYNLDLSYKRAKSIFAFVFDPKKMSFEHQQQLRPLVKVSGKSFFDSVKTTRNVASMTAQEFCKKYDCKKSQKVLIKFNIDQK
jgi:outer membrane protein OmpA-like peptidoglycan-associated protein